MLNFSTLALTLLLKNFKSYLKFSSFHYHFCLNDLVLKFSTFTISVWIQTRPNSANSKRFEACSPVLQRESRQGPHVDYPPILVWHTRASLALASGGGQVRDGWDGTSNWAELFPTFQWCKIQNFRAFGRNGSTFQFVWMCNGTNQLHAITNKHTSGDVLAEVCKEFNNIS